MIYFWFAFMLSISVVYLLWFLYRPSRNKPLNLEQSNIELGKQKRLELQSDLEQGLIDAADFNQANDEIAQTLALELSQHNHNTRFNTPPSFWLSGLIIVFLLALSLGIYQILSPKPQPPTIQTQIMSLSLEDSVIKLQNRLLENPNDAKAWQILGLAYFELGKLDKSLNAYEKAYQLEPKNPRLLTEYASTLAIKNDNNFSGRSIELIKQALEIEPNAPDALYMAGLFAVSEHDFPLAKKLWQRALSVLSTDSPDRAVLLEVLAQLETLTIEDQGKSSKTETKHFVRVKVDFSDKILATRGDDFIMIYAKPVHGRPMPIAIQKIKLKNFNTSITLTDAHSIIPSRKLSQANQIIITARLSKSGAAIKQADDIQISSEAVNIIDNPTVYLQFN